MIVRDQVAVFAQPGALPEAALADVIGQARNLDMDEVRKAVAEQQAKAAQGGLAEQAQQGEQAGQGGQGGQGGQ
jgi:thioredoxin 1